MNDLVRRILFPFYPYIAGIVAAVLAVVTAWFAAERRGAKKEQLKEKRKIVEDFIQTRKRIDDAENNPGNDPDVAREWLRKRR